MNNKPLDDARAPANTWHTVHSSGYEDTLVLNVPTGCVLRVRNSWFEVDSGTRKTDALVYIPGVTATPPKKGCVELTVLSPGSQPLSED